MVKAIIFDFFDVIYPDGLAAMLRKRSIDHTADIESISRDLDLGVIDDDQLFERLARVFGESPDELRRECDGYNTLNESLLPIIESLTGAYRVGLLSDAPSEFLRGLLRDNDLARLFNNITISSEVGMRKPDPAIFKHILSELQVSPVEAIFIDDKSKNVEAAEGLGMKGIVYTDTPSLLGSLHDLGINLPSHN